MNHFFKDNLTSNPVLSTSLRSRTLAVLIALITTATAWAYNGETFPLDGVSYKVTNESTKEVAVSSCDEGLTGALIIPKTVSKEDLEGNLVTYNVTSISTPGFNGHPGLTSISIPYNVKTIEANTFANCTGLTSINIPSSVTSIEMRAFQGCTGLTSITIPNWVTTIGREAFEGCTGLKKVTIGSAVTSIEKDAFKGCTNVNEVICLPDASELTTWNDYDCDDFKGSKNSKTTVCYVSNPSDYSPKFSDVNVTFKQYYDLDIAGTKVTEDNKANILGDGAASYDPTSKTLTLSKDITSNWRVIHSKISGLKIVVETNVTLESTSTNVSGEILFFISPTTISGPGVLTLKGCNGYGVYIGGALIIDQAVINISGTRFGFSVLKGLSIKGSAVNISSTEAAFFGGSLMSPITLSNCHVSHPSGAKFENYKFVDASGDVCKAVTILPDNSPGVFVSEMAFPDENFRNWLLSQDYGKSGYITATGLAGVTTIIVNKMSIADLKGIEYFTALENLKCYNNKLKALDVSKNTALKFLNCSENQLTTLNVSTNTALTTLSCENNQLTALDVKANTALEILYCEHNQLSALDVSANTSLTELYCHENKLTALDVTANTALMNLICYGNQIRGTAMQTFINSLHSNGGDPTLCVYTSAATDGNEINTIQVGKAKAKKWTVMAYDGSSIADYAGIHAVAIDETNFPDYNFRENWILKQTFADDNYLNDKEAASVTAIDVSSKGIADLTGIEHFTALKTLNCSGNYLTTSTLDVSKNEALEVLNCSSNYNLTTINLSKNTKLKTLDCSNNYEMTALDVSANTALQTLRCNNNQLNTLDVSKNTALKELYCYCNYIRDEGMQTLISSLHQNGGTLYAYDTTNDQNEMTTTHVADAKAKKWQVKAWDGSKYVDYAGIFAVDINATNFPDAAFRNYVSTLDANPTNGYLTEDEINPTESMEVSSMNITSLKGIEYFTALKYLKCEGNQLTDLDLSKNTTLEVLDCSNNKLTALDVKANTALTTLDCYDNQLTALDVSANTALEYLNCSNNKLTALDMTHNTSLEQLDCSGNNIRKGMQALVSSLPQNNGTFLVYNSAANDGNRITTEQVDAASEKGWMVAHWDGTDWCLYVGILLGDANGDEYVDVADIVAIVSHQKGQDVEGFNLPAADVNDDGKADGKDVELISKIIMKE